jgi:peroxiredoxin
LREHEPEFQELGARLAVVGLSDREHARKFRNETGIAFPLLVDDERRAYGAIDLKKGNIFQRDSNSIEWGRIRFNWEEASCLVREM